jgi:hypothetical protein
MLIVTDSALTGGGAVAAFFAVWPKTGSVQEIRQIPTTLLCAHFANIIFSSRVTGSLPLE